MKGFYLKDIYFDGKRPFFVYRYKETGAFYGRGVPEMIAPYRKLMNDVFNFAVNGLMLQILPWGFYRIGSSFRPEEVRLSPGVMIPVDDINDVKIAQFPATVKQLQTTIQSLAYRHRSSRQHQLLVNLRQLEPAILKSQRPVILHHARLPNRKHSIHIQPTRHTPV